MIPPKKESIDFVKFHIINMEMFQELDMETQITVLRLVEHSIKLYLEGLFIDVDEGPLQ